MATDLDPDSSTFTTTAMLPASGEGILATFAQNLAKNTGYNWLGTLSKLKISFGYKSIDTAGTSPQTTTVTFSSDKLDGYSSFSLNNYGVLFAVNDENTGTILTASGGNFIFLARNKSTTAFDIRYIYEGTAPITPTTLQVFWIAIGF